VDFVYPLLIICAVALVGAAIGLRRPLVILSVMIGCIFVANLLATAHSDSYVARTFRTLDGESVFVIKYTLRGMALLIVAGMAISLELAYRRLYEANRNPPRLTTLGSGGFAYYEESAAEGFFQPSSGILLARAKPPNPRRRTTIEQLLTAFGMSRPDPQPTEIPRLLQLQGPGNIACIAPPGSGKGVGFVIPCCLAFPESLVVTDIKGEIYAVTGRHRRERLGQEVHVFDPFGITDAAPSGVDILSIVGEESFVDDCKHLAALLIPMPASSKSEDEFWIQSARTLVAGLIAHLVRGDIPAKDRHVGTLRRWLSLSEPDFDKLLATMADGAPVPKSLDAMQAEMEAVAAGKPIPPVVRKPPELFAAACANIIRTTPEKTRGGVMAQARSATGFLDSPGVIAALSRPLCDLAQIKRRPMSLYFAIPDTRLQSHAGFLRLLIAATLAAIKADRTAPNRVLLMLDEFGNLGKMEEIENDMTLLRGYKGHICVIAQSIGQLKKIYGEEGFANIMANSKVQMFFGIGDLPTLKYVSELLGEMTIKVESITAGTNWGTSTSASTPAMSFMGETSGGASTTRGSNSGGSVSLTVNLQKRHLMTHDEIGRMAADKVIINIQAARSILADRLTYYRDPEFQGLYDSNPMHTGG